MSDLKELGAKHGAPAVIAALVAGTISATSPPPTKEKIIEKPVQVTVATSKHAWPDLSDAQKEALAARLGWLSGSKVMIFCDGADCRDLQTDLDDAFEDAKVNSERAIPVNPLGYGIAVVYAGERERADRLASDISTASEGRVSPKVEANASAADGLMIVIGKRPR